MSALGSIVFVVRRMRPEQKRQLLLSQIALIAAVVFELLIPQQIQRIIDEGIRNEDVATIVWTSMIMVVFALLSTAGFMTASWLGSLVATETAHRIRVGLYDKVTSLSFGDLDRFRTGPLLVRLTSDIGIVRNGMMMAIIMVIRAPVMLIGALALVALETPSLLVPTLGVVAAMGLLIGVIVPSLNPLYAAQQERLDRLNTVLQENLAGVQVVKNFVRQPLEIERYTERNDGLYSAALRPARRIAFMEPSFMTLLYVAVAVALFITERSGAGSLTAGELATFFNYLLTAMLPIAFLGFVLPELGRMGASLGRFRDIFTTQAEVRESDDPVALDRIDGRIEFDDVCMHYLDEAAHHGETPVLDSVSFVIEPGETVVVLGATGSGKTSLVHLVPRFYDVTRGAVRVDGVDVRDARLSDLRRQIAVTFQQPQVFSGSVTHNVKMGKPDASTDEVMAASRAADADAFVSALPDGYESDVAERGLNLSGGQRQRIALARALVSEPRILILDDTTSAVDLATESRIQRRLAEEFTDVTVLMVAQRVSAALNADRVLLLEDGRLVGNGTHDELLAESALYRSIVESQLGPLAEVENLFRAAGPPPESR
ncbi:MAG: ABC transporter ATP-binding protein [Acidimicrobiia bacterium]|nr:ABC transporter ATP-binding protein [Acidimicrobiia bacterium]